MHYKKQFIAIASKMLAAHSYHLPTINCLLFVHIITHMVVDCIQFYIIYTLQRKEDKAKELKSTEVEEAAACPRKFEEEVLKKDQRIINY